jgi:hypothetical protein
MHDVSEHSTPAPRTSMSPDNASAYTGAHAPVDDHESSTASPTTRSPASPLTPAAHVRITSAGGGAGALPDSPPTPDFTVPNTTANISMSSSDVYSYVHEAADAVTDADADADAVIGSPALLSPCSSAPTTTTTTTTTCKIVDSDDDDDDEDHCIPSASPLRMGTLLQPRLPSKAGKGEMGGSSDG